MIRSWKALLAVLAGIAIAAPVAIRWTHGGRKAVTASSAGPTRHDATRDDSLVRHAEALPLPSPASAREVQDRLAESNQPLTVERLLGGGRVDRAQLQDLLRLAVSELPAEDRYKVLRAVGAWLGAYQPVWSDELLRTLEDFHDRFALAKAMVEVMAHDDPRGAADWVAKLKEPALREGALNFLAMEWATKDTAAAAAWAAELPIELGRGAAFEGVAWVWAQRDTKSAYAWAMSIQDPTLRDQVLVKMAKMIATQDGKSAATWAQQFPEGATRDEALHYAVFQWATRDLSAAAQWAGQIADPQARTETELAIARSWAGTEPKGATAWAAAIADPAARAMALQATVQKWAEADLAGAAQWIGAQSAAPSSLEIFRSVTANLASSQPELARRWVSSAADPAWRSVGETIVAGAGGAARSP